MLRKRLPGLDGLRALAVAAVVVFHANPAWLPGGFLGVDLFFVISGYLITRLLLAEVGNTGRLRLLRFYQRRVIRLFPALLALLVAVTVASVSIWQDELPTLRGSVLSGLGYVSNWWSIGSNQSYFVASGRPPMLEHLWSLAIEEQFYLLWPLVLIGLTRTRRRFGVVAAVAGAGALASTGLMAVIAIRDGVPYEADSTRIYFGTDTHAMGLLLGAAMGALAARAEFRPKRSWRFRRWVTDLIGLAGLAALVLVALNVNEFSEPLYRGGFGVVSVLAVLVVSTVTRQGSHLGRLLDVRALRWLGDRSYSIYLWHWPVVVVTRPGIDLPASPTLAGAVRIVAPVLLAAGSYTLVEKPLRVRGARWLAERDERARARALGVTVGRRRRLAPRLAALTVLATAVLAAVAGPGGHARPAEAATAAGRSVRSADTQPFLGDGLDAVDRERSAPQRRAVPARAFNASAGPSAASTGQSHPTTATTQPLASPAASMPAQAAPRKPMPSKSVTSKSVPTQPGASRSAPGSSMPAKSTPPAITAYGDSVMLGAQPAINADFPHSQVHAVEGRQPYVTLQEVRADQAAHALSPVVVIHTGNNGIIRPSDLSDTLTALKDRQRVVLLTDRVPRDWQGPNNDTIKRVGHQFANVVVLDWYSVSNGNSAWFYEDGLHLRPPGAAGYAARLLAAATS